jgi:hypothetical protein
MILCIIKYCQFVKRAVESSLVSKTQDDRHMLEVRYFERQHHCSKSFHGRCMEVSSELIAYLNSRIDLSWSCKDCVGDPVQLETKQYLNLLMKKISSMADDIEVLKAKSGPSPTFSSLLRNNLETPKSAKRRIDDRGGQSVKRPCVATPAMIIGSGGAANDLNPVAPIKWRNVSRLDPETTEEAVTNKLSGALNVDSNAFKCVKLTPKMESQHSSRSRSE